MVINIVLAAVLVFQTAATQSYEVKATKYCHGAKKCAVVGKGITASGSKVRKGIIAADWKFLPKHTIIQILTPAEVAGIYVVEDTGAKIKGRRIDIWTDSQSDAVKFGVKKIKLRILKK